MAQPYTGPNLGPLRPTEGPATADPYAQHFGDAPPPSAAQATPSDDSSNYDHAFSDTPPESLPGHDISASGAGFSGLANALTFGASPAIAGLAEASGIPSAIQPGEDGLDVNPIRPIVGAAKLLHNYLSDHPDPEVQASYDRGRKAQLNDERLAQEQHPAAFIAGQLGGALLTPLGMAGVVGKGAGIAARVAEAVLSGTVGGGLYGAGDAIGKGEDASNIGIDAAKGAGVGAAFGTIAGAGGHAIGQGFDKAASIFRGTRNVDAEAGGRIVNALQADMESQGPQFGRAEIDAANAAGTPRAIIDSGGERTRALARSSANTSPEGRQALTELTQNRFEDQAPRIGGFIRQITGGANADAENEALQNAARIANEPRYKRVMDANPVVNVPSEITSRPAVAQAMNDAVSLAKNYGEKIQGAPELKTILSGPGYHIADDVPNAAKTSLKYWDYVKKAMDARIKRLLKSGGIDELNSKEKADLGGLIDAKNALIDHLDSVAKGYKEARAGAAAFFGAENALEAGQKFVLSNANINEARRVLSKMSPPERELFARGFASDLADKIERTGDTRNVLNSIFLNNGPARQKIYIALGVARATQLEALLRVEHIVDHARKAVSGNSSTIRQMAESGLAGGGAVAAFEGLKEHDFNPVHVLTAALTFGAVRHGAKVIDSRVARRVGEMLASNDASVLAKGVKVVASRPDFFDAIRRATAAGVRISARDIGPEKAAAGAFVAGQRIIAGPSQPDHGHDSLSDQLQ